MNVTVKKGSIITIPLLAGWTVSSAEPQTVLAKMQGTAVVLTGVNPGSAHLTLSPAADVSVTLTVTVTA